MKMPKTTTPKMTPPKASGLGVGGGKPHMRMRKLKPAAPSAFPTAAAAFPPSAGPMTPDQSMTAPPGGMPPSAAPGDMGE